MKLIALTGGIAAGKSTIARRLGELGAIHIDADQLAREVVEPGTVGLARIAELFGLEVMHPDGTLDRPALGRIVFDDPRKLAALNAIIHPEVRALAQRRIAAAREADPEAIVIYDVPLLVESAVDHDWDLVVVAEAPAAVREERLVQLRGLTPEEARRRIENQASDEERRAIADIVIDTGGSEEHTDAQVDALWDRLAHRSASG